MSQVAPIAALSLATVAPPSLTPVKSTVAPGASFAQLITQGVADVDEKLRAADTMVQAFALDDSVPVHQVTFALEQARLSVELMMQVRNRMLEGYQELMRMQV